MAEGPHRPGLVLLVLLVLGVYCGATTVPFPGHAALAALPLLQSSFTAEGFLAQDLWIFYFPENWVQQRKLLFLAIAAGFVLGYYLPRELKRRAHVAVTLAVLAWLLGPLPALELLVGLMAVYAIHFGPKPTALGTLAGFALGGAVAAAQGLELRAAWGVPFWISGIVMFLGPLSFLGYASLVHPLLPTRAGPWFGACAANFCWLYLGGCLLWNAATGGTAGLLPGVLLVFWLWERQLMVLQELRDGQIPGDLPLADFLATFLSPAYLVNVSYMARIGKGYTYLSRAFLAADRNEVSLSGLKLIGWSFCFLCLRPVFLNGLHQGFVGLGAAYQGYSLQVLQRIHQGGDVAVSAVWLGLLLDFFDFYFLWTTVGHLKVGVWRLCGYPIEPYFQSPFRATNLVDLWRRFSFYYREFLVQVFYYPVFLRLRKRPVWLRVMCASMAAAGLGNFLFHLLEGLLYRGPTLEVFLALCSTTPYFVIFGGAIGLVGVALTRWGRRQPWTGPWYRLAGDLLGMLSTFAFFIVLRMFRLGGVEFDFRDCLALALTALGF